MGTRPCSRATIPDGVLTIGDEEHDILATVLIVKHYKVVYDSAFRGSIELEVCRALALDGHGDEVIQTGPERCAQAISSAWTRCRASACRASCHGVDSERGTHTRHRTACALCTVMQYASCIVVDRDGPLLAILPVDADLFLPLSDTTRPTIAVVMLVLFPVR
jgi:hypothetical protein